MESGEVLHQSFSQAILFDCIRTVTFAVINTEYSILNTQAWASLNREAVEEAGKLGEVS